MGRGISNSRSSPASESRLSAGGLSLRHLVQAIAEGEESVERDEVLVFEDGVDSAGELLMDALAVGGFLSGAGKRSTISLGEALGLPAAASSVPSEARVESKSWVAEVILAKGSIIFCQESLRAAAGISPWRARICQRPMLAWRAPRVFPRRAWLEILSIESATVTKRVAESSVRSGNSEKTRYQLLNCENLAGEQADGLGRELTAGGASAVDLAHGEVDLERADVGDDAREGDHGVEQLFGVIEVVVFVPVMDGLRIGLLAQDLFPDVEISGDVGIAVGLPLEAGEEDEEVGGLAEDAAGRGGFKIVSAEVAVEALQTPFIGEVFALRFGDARENVVVGGEPSVVFGEQVNDEFTGIVGAGSGEIFPGDGSPGSAGDDDAIGANGYLAAVEVEGGGVGEEPAEAGRAQQGLPGLGVGLGYRPIEAGDGGIVDDLVDDVDVAFFLSGAEGGPIVLVKHDGDTGGGVGIVERNAFLEGFFKLGERKAGVDGEKGAFGIGGFEEEVFCAAAFAQAIAEDLDEGAGVVAAGDVNGVGRSGEDLKLSGLLDVAIEQEEELGGGSALVALQVDVAGDEGEHIGGSDLLADGGHAQKRSQRSGDGGGFDRGGRCGRGRGGKA